MKSDLTGLLKKNCQVRLRLQEYVGPDTTHADLHIAVRADTTGAEAERITETLMERLHREMAGIYCPVHVDPSGPEGKQVDDPDQARL